MNWWSRPTANDCASARAIWNLLVSLSMRIGLRPPSVDICYDGTCGPIGGFQGGLRGCLYRVLDQRRIAFAAIDILR
jgi:hypothetical protein